MQARVLRTIDKVGGLDEYLMGESPGRVRELGMEGWKMKWRLMQTEWGRERMRRRRVELGARPQGVEMVLPDSVLLEEEDVEGKGKEVEVRFVEEDGGEEDDYEEDGGEENDYEEVNISEEEADRMLKEDPRTKELPWLQQPAAEEPRKSILQRLTRR